ncbi:MAG: chemotaxis protein CheX [Planctomycetota bacterium]
MDVRYINPFIHSIRNTFQTMCGFATNVEKPQLKHGNDPASDVSGVIGFSGDAAGSVVLHFSFEVASKVASAFAKITIDPQHPDFADALGELANMVAGGAKAQFEGLRISISLPNVIVGKNHSVSCSKTTPRIVIPCNTECGTFYVEVGMVLARPATRVAPVGEVGVLS